MTKSKEWNWNAADKSRWLTPSEDGVFFAQKWQKEGAQSLLDLGCGLGRHAVYFAQRGFEVTAVDLSEDAIAHTEALGKEKAVDVTCRKADMMKLPFAAATFDRVFSYHVISHQDTSGVRSVIDEITRVLKPEGKVFLTLCSKEHCAFKNPDFRHIDENTVLKTEGAEIDVPHFFADKALLKELFCDYDFISVRHITDCRMDGEEEQERSHYYIEAVVNKK